MDYLPMAILLDLDDTILDTYSDPDMAWLQLCREFAGSLGDMSAEKLQAAVLQARDWYWSDMERARLGRLHMLQARRDILLRAFAQFNIPDSPHITRMVERYNQIRDEAMRPFPGAIETLGRLQTTDIRLGLLTNGSAEMQRGKIERFSLAEYFDHIQIEGEFGIGKPDERAFRHALGALGAEPTEAWMVGDNLDFDIRGAQQAGIYAVWVDSQGTGLPDGTTVRPDRIIVSLSDLLS
jgi:putative hydrolase of the HAD superfamily